MIPGPKEPTRVPEDTKGMNVPAEYAAEIRKLFPKEPTAGLVQVLQKGISRVRAQRRFKKKTQS